MDVFNAISSRRSIRLYKNTPVDKDDLFLIIEMGLKAPSSGNLQDYRFVVNRDKGVINKLPELCMDQYWMSSAPAVIAVCSQPQVQGEWFGERGRHVFSIQNAAAATQNILLAAHALGLGACWVGGFDQERVDDLFGVSGKGRVEAIITVGYPAEKPEKKTEIDINTGLFFDSFGNDKEDLAVINKDYSIIVQRRLDRFKDEAQKSAKTGKEWLSIVKEKIKSHHNKYKDSLEHKRE